MKTSLLALGNSKVLEWSVVASTTTASNHRGYFVDTSAGTYTIDLPANPGIGYTVSIGDGAGNASNHNITIGRNGSLINASASNETITTDDEMLTFVYSGSTVGWKIVSSVQSAAADSEIKQDIFSSMGTGDQNATYKYDFFSWTSGTDSPYSGYGVSGAGRSCYLEVGGGYVGNKSTQIFCEYDGTNWHSRASMPAPPRQYTAAVTWGHKFYLAYGYNYAANVRIQDCDYWDGFVWTGATDGPDPTRDQVAGFSRSVGIYVCGGYWYDGSNYHLSQDNDFFNGSSWTSKTDMPFPARRFSGGGSLNDVGYIFYGLGSAGLKDCDAFDGSSWSNQTDAIGSARYECSTGQARDRIVSVGGNNGSSRIKDIEAYDSSNWISLDDYPITNSLGAVGGV